MSIIDMSKENQSEVMATDKLILIDFWSTTCRPCKAMLPIIQTLAGSMPEKLQVLKVNTGEEQALAEKFSVQGVPTLVLYRDGQEVDRKTGYLKASQMKAWIEGLV